MIYRVHVAVLRSVADDLLDIPEAERTWLDMVAYTFGINALDATDAVGLAESAAKDAIDTSGDYIGGIVLEVDCRAAFPDEFSIYKEYCHSPMNERGIFYVSGVTYSAITKVLSTEVIAMLATAKERITLTGIPVPSFVHPQSPESPPTRVRMLCSACGHWIEVSNTGLICSFMSGLDMFSREGEEAKKVLDEAGPFVSRHIAQCSAFIEGVHEDDPRWHTLESGKREENKES